jgi:CRISPR-associated endonuclease/helicase Cas3
LADGTEVKVLSGIFESYQQIGISKPHDFQVAAWESIVQGRNTLISAGTGTGKTEAALLPALAMAKRVILLYPTKALLQDQRGRVSRLANGRNVAVDTGDEDDRQFYHADIILSSLDKFIFRLFGYGKRRWSYLYPYRIGFESPGGSVLILDEAHAYEEIAFSHFWFLLKKLAYERRVQTVLLSATLPPGLADAVEDRERKWFPRPAEEGPFFDRVVDGQAASGSLAYAGTCDRGDVVRAALDSFGSGRRVIIVLERVMPNERLLSVHGVWDLFVAEAAAGVQGEFGRASLAADVGRATVTGNVLTYHGHQMPSYRARVLEQLKRLDEGWKPGQDGRPRTGEPFILVTTSAMEVGVDISCDLMITDLCEPDSFAQRIGRCARRSGESGVVRVIAHADGTVPVHGRLLHEFLKDRSSDSPLDSEAKQALNALNAAPDLRRVPSRLEFIQDESLYRYVYDFVEENRELWEKGIIVTREWEPAITFVLSERCYGQECIGGIAARDFWRGREIKEKLALPLSAAADLAQSCTWVFEGCNEGNQYGRRISLGGTRSRTLADALEVAGLRPRKSGDGRDENKVKPLYGFGIPLVLMLAVREQGAPTYRDANRGLAYRPLYAPRGEAKFPPAGSALLEVAGVVLKKTKGADNAEYSLPLYWYKPKETEAPGQGVAL